MKKRKVFPERHSYAHMNFVTSHPEDVAAIAMVGKALASPLRIQMLNLVQVFPLNVSTIAQKLGIPVSTAVFNLEVLEDAGLIRVDYSPKAKGHNKWYSYYCQEVDIRTHDFSESEGSILSFERAIPIGDFIDGKLDSACGMASENDHFFSNRPTDLFLDKRHEAQLIWSSPTGYLTYAFQNSFFLGTEPHSLVITLELCSEANGYNPVYPSDITFWINGIEVGTYTSPGDFGDRMGHYTPSWWYLESTKYGLLVSVEVTESGSFINGQMSSKKVTISSLNLDKGDRVLFKLGVKNDAVNRGGFNIFGEKFGDFNQAIVVRSTCSPKKK